MMIRPDHQADVARVAEETGKPMLPTPYPFHPQRGKDKAPLPPAERITPPADET